jgi:N-acetyl-gamma-glutamyl-phosphate reductase
VKYIKFYLMAGDFARGIFVTSYCESDLSLDEANDLYKTFTIPILSYILACNDRFKTVIVNTNKCVLYIGKKWTIKLLYILPLQSTQSGHHKGLQNMNLMFGWWTDRDYI